MNVDGPILTVTLENEFVHWVPQRNSNTYFVILTLNHVIFSFYP